MVQTFQWATHQAATTKCHLAQNEMCALVAFGCCGDVRLCVQVDEHTESTKGYEIFSGRIDLHTLFSLLPNGQVGYKSTLTFTLTFFSF